MEFDTTPIPLKPETRAVLKEIQRSTEPTAAYALDPGPAEDLLKSITEPMIGGAALPQVTLQQMRWYVRDLSGVFRTRYGYALAFQLGLMLRKWAALGLEPNTMQYLLCEICRQLELEPKPEPDTEEAWPEPDAGHTEPGDSQSRETAVHRGPKEEARSGPPP
jgi:hypothetical protein